MNKFKKVCPCGRSYSKGEEIMMLCDCKVEDWKKEQGVGYCSFCKRKVHLGTEDFGMAGFNAKFEHVICCVSDICCKKFVIEIKKDKRV